MSIDNCNRLGLGSVQFGLDYGVSNVDGQVPPTEVGRILEYAAKVGIRIIDTASMYGDSESVLGQTISEDLSFRIVTKTSKIIGGKVTPDDVTKIQAGFNQSLQRLQRTNIYGLLVHNADDLLKEGGERLSDLLCELRSSGRVQKVGVSVYSAEQIDRILEILTPDIVQLPLNVLDQRLIYSGHLVQLKSLGVEIHTRSTFLQGLLLMHPEDLDPFFDPIREHMRRYLLSLNQVGLSPIETALGLAFAQEEIDAVIVGVCSQRELTEICEAARNERIKSIDFKCWSIKNEDILNPAKWHLQRRPVSQGVK